MPRHVCTGAKLKCSFAMPPGITNFNVIPDNSKMIDNMHAANIYGQRPHGGDPAVWHVHGADQSRSS